MATVHCYFRPVQCQSLWWQTLKSNWARPKGIVWKPYSCNQLQVYVCLSASQPAAPVCTLWDTVWPFKENLKGAQLRKIPRFHAHREKYSPLNLTVWMLDIHLKTKKLRTQLFLERKAYCTTTNFHLSSFWLWIPHDILLYDFTSSLMQKHLLPLSFITHDNSHNIFYRLYCSNAQHFQPVTR